MGYKLRNWPELNTSFSARAVDIWFDLCFKWFVDFMPLASRTE